MSLNVNVVSLSYFMFVYFLVCLQLHVSNKVGRRRRRRRREEEKDMDGKEENAEKRVASCARCVYFGNGLEALATSPKLGRLQTIFNRISLANIVTSGTRNSLVDFKKFSIEFLVPGP